MQQPHCLQVQQQHSHYIFIVAIGYTEVYYTTSTHNIVMAKHQNKLPPLLSAYDRGNSDVAMTQVDHLPFALIHPR